MSYTISKKNPSSSEERTSLVNASDGAGLHLANGGQVLWTNTSATNFGLSDFSVEFILNQTGDNTADNYIWFSNQSGNSRVYVYNDISDDKFRVVFINSAGSASGINFILPYDMSADYGTPTHYVLTCDRDGDATLYKNGNSVGAVSISAASTVDIGDGNTSQGRFGSSSTYGVLGTFYRFRTWNKLVDAKALYERADVDFADQYATTNAPFTSINLSSGWSTVTGGTSIVDSDSFTTTTSGAGVSYPLTVGKRYRVSWNISGAAYDSIRQYTSSEGLITISSATSGTVEFTAERTSLYIRNGGAGTTDIASMSLVQIGCVSDYELSANPTQSLTVQDRSGAADGTCSSSGVTQVQPVVQLNAKAARIGTSAATVADGDVAASGGLLVSKNQQSTTGTPFSGAAIKVLPANTTNTTGVSSLALSTSTVDNYGYLISGHRAGSDGGPTLRISSHSSSDTGTEVLTIDSTGKTTSKAADNVFTVQDTEDTVADANAEVRIGESNASGNLNNYWGLKFAGTAAGGDLVVNRNGTTALTIASNGSTTFQKPDGAVVSLYRNDTTILDGNTFGRLQALSGDSNHTAGTEVGSIAFKAYGNQTGTRPRGQIRFEIANNASQAEAMRIEPDKKVTFYGGVTFGNQTDSTAASNITTLLDHYERGVWTPVIADAATGGNTGSGSTVTGYYERIGNAVTVNGLATNVNTSGMTGSNVLFVRGLPFPAGYSSGTFSNLGRAVGSCVLDSVDVDTSTRSVSTMVTGQNSYFTFHQTRDAVGDSNILVSNLSSGTADLFFSFTYFVN